MARISPSQWADLHRRLDEALDLPTEAHVAFAERVYADEPALRRELLEMIEAADATEEFFLDRPVVGGADEASGADSAVEDVAIGGVSAPSEPPTQAGPYRLAGLLGAGGMGEVYLAHRADDEYQKQVAIKILRPEASDGETVRRFRHERQILAGLDHPGIAGLLDGGTTDDGRPFLAMEFVQGEPIDRYCEIHNLGVEARLDLFRKVCEAVHFAHQRLVVHRDLKPSNILITEDGRPKLLDFGIAKLLDPEALDLGRSYESPVTAVGLRPMTLAYASPEQMLGLPLTTASDVYSLGVLLYELLAGRRPYNISPKDPMSAFRAICEQEPPRPSTVVWDIERFDLRHVGAPPDLDGKRLRRRLSGDLDGIVLKALAKDPAARYSSVEQLATDLSSHRLGLPISARPHTFAYRTAKFLRRHRWGVTATVTFIGMLIGLSIAFWSQREESRLQQRRAESVSAFLIELFSQSDPDESRGRVITVEEVLEQGVERLAELPGDEDLRVPLLDTMGVSFMHLGRFERADELFREALELSRRNDGDQSLETARALSRLAELEDWWGRYPEAEAAASEALGIFLELLGPQHPETVMARVRRGRSRHLLGRFADAEVDLSSALTAIELGNDPEADERRIETLVLFAVLLQDMDRLDEAEVLHLEALDLARSSLQLPHRRYARMLNGYGLLLEKLGRLEAAEASFVEAESMQRRLFKGAHAELATTWHNLANLRSREARFEEAVDLFSRSLDMRRDVLGSDHPDVARSLGALSRAYQHLRRWDEAEAGFLESLRIFQDQLGEQHVDTARALQRLAQLMTDLGRLGEAEGFYRRSLDVQRRTLGSSHTAVGISLNNLGEVYSLRGEYERAQVLFEESVEILRSGLGEDHADTVMTRFNLAVTYHFQGRYESAEQGYDQALAGARRAMPSDHYKIAMILVSSASLKRTLQRFEDGATQSREAIDILRGKSGLRAWKARAFSELTLNLQKLDRAEELAEACALELGRDFSSKACAGPAADSESAVSAASLPQ